jgi:hypothetical protein
VASSFTPGARNPKPCGGQHRLANGGRPMSATGLTCSPVLRRGSDAGRGFPAAPAQSDVCVVYRPDAADRSLARCHRMRARVSDSRRSQTLSTNKTGAPAKGARLKVDIGLGGPAGFSSMAAVRCFSQVLLSLRFCWAVSFLHGLGNSVRTVPFLRNQIKCSFVLASVRGIHRISTNPLICREFHLKIHTNKLTRWAYCSGKLR